jgi:hypothetical protein
MFRSCTHLTLIASIALCGLTGGHLASAQEAKSAEAKIVADLGVAAQLAAFGNGELNEMSGMAKDFRSPEAIVAAGIIMVKAHKATGGKLSDSKVEVMEEGGKEVAAEGKPRSLLDDANDLFDTARGMAKGDQAAALEKRIKEALGAESRGASGGPRVITRTIKTGKAHNLKIDFDPNCVACVTMRSTGRTQFEVVGNGGKVLWHSQGNMGVYTWRTGGASGGGERNITVRVINAGGPPVAYTVITN